MDAVTPHESPFDLSRRVMLRENTDEGPCWCRWTRPHPAAGDVLTVRIGCAPTVGWTSFT